MSGIIYIVEWDFRTSGLVVACLFCCQIGIYFIRSLHSVVQIPFKVLFDSLYGIKTSLPLNFSPVRRASSGGSDRGCLNTPKVESTLMYSLPSWLYIARCGYLGSWWDALWVLLFVVTMVSPCHSPFVTSQWWCCLHGGGRWGVLSRLYGGVLFFDILGSPHISLYESHSVVRSYIFKKKF